MQKLLLIVALFLVSTFTSCTYAQTSTCELGEVWQHDIYAVQKKAFLKNLPNECRKLLKYDTAESSENYKDIVRTNGKYDGSNDWEASMIPEEEPRTAIFKKMSMAKHWGLNGSDEVLSYLNGEKEIKELPETINFIRVMGSKGRALVLNGIKGERSPLNKSNDQYQMGPGLRIASNPAVSTAICAEMNVIKAVSCGEGLRKIIKWMQIDFISLPEVFDSTLRNKKYEAGIADAAKKIITKANEKKPGSTHLYEDLYQSFLSTGSSKKEAENMAWDTLGLLSTAGVNLGGRLRQIRDPEYSNKSMVSLLAIANTTPLLDLLSRKENGETYSFPPGMKFNCDNGKSYHFLMTAYLSHRLIEEGLDSESAAMASYISDKGYQMMGSHNARKSDTVQQYPPFHDENNLKRLDLTHAAAGAWFGATNSVKDIDKGLDALISAANPLPFSKSWEPNPNTWEEGLKKITDAVQFNNTIKPNAVFEYFKK